MFDDGDAGVRREVGQSICSVAEGLQSLRVGVVTRTLDQTLRIVVFFGQVLSCRRIWRMCGHLAMDVLLQSGNVCERERIMTVKWCSRARVDGKIYEAGLYALRNTRRSWEKQPNRFCTASYHQRHTYRLH